MIALAHARRRMWQLIGGALPTERDETGAFFIDRDGALTQTLTLALALAQAPACTLSLALALTRRALPPRPQLPARRRGPPAA